MCFVDSPLCFGLGQSLNVGIAVDVRGVHDVGRVGGGKQKDRDQNVDDEIHRRDIVVVDNDSVKRPLFGLFLLIGMDFWNGQSFGWHEEIISPPPTPPVTA